MEHNSLWFVDEMYEVKNQDEGVRLESNQARSPENADPSSQTWQDSDQAQSQGESNMGKENHLDRNIEKAILHYSRYSSSPFSVNTYMSQLSMELDHLSDEELNKIKEKAENLLTSRKYANGFKKENVAFCVGEDSFKYSAPFNLLYKQDKLGFWQPSRYQFLLDAANKPRNGKPFIVKNVLDYMIAILTNIRSEIL